MIDHEHDEEGNCIIPEQPIPSWRFSIWDVIGVTLTTAGGVFSVLGQGFTLMSREFAAMANYRRANYDAQRAARAQEAESRSAAAELRALVDGDGSS